MVQSSVGGRGGDLGGRGGQGWGLRRAALPVTPPLTLQSPPSQKLYKGGALIPVGQT